MEIKDFEKAIDHETQWLRYYANSDTRELLKVDSNIYNTLVSIGYAKKYTPLYIRCAWCIVTCDKIIDKDTEISDLKIIGESRNIELNKYTPLEVYWMKYPEKRQDIINILC